MLKKISFKNYKAFKEGELEIRPITVLLGANSIGKTSVLQFLLMLQQTALASETYESALKLAGAIIHLGDGKNILRKQRINECLEFSIDFQDNSLLSHLQRQVERRMNELGYYARLVHHFSVEASKTKKERGKVVNKTLDSLNEFENPGVDFKDRLSLASKVAEMSAANYKRASGLVDRKFLNELLPKRAGYAFQNFGSKKDEVIEAFKFLSNFFQGAKPDSVFTFEYRLRERENIFLIEYFKFSEDGRDIFEFEIKEGSYDFQINFTSPLLEANRTAICADVSASLKNYIKRDATIFAFANKKPDDSALNGLPHDFLTSIVVEIIQVSLSRLDDYFDEKNIGYVAPVRAHPSRFYFLDKAKSKTYLDTRDGDSMAEILKGNPALKIKVNKYLKDFDIAIEVKTLEDMLAKLRISHNSLTLDITDVGYGISQVLPVIIQTCLSLDDSITLIEQPEVHLHPTMQADLVDFFLEIIERSDSNPKQYCKSLVIETHSEYILKRLRRRIAEGKIAASDVAIYLVEADPNPQNQNSILTRLDIEAQGAFEYPTDFYSGELLQDELVFLSLQRVEATV